MPSVPPALISALSHVTLLLYVILIVILSVWTRHRVKKALLSSPDINDVFLPVQSTRKRSLPALLSAASNPSFKANRFGPGGHLLQRSLSYGSAPIEWTNANLEKEKISKKSKKSPPAPLILGYSSSANSSRRGSIVKHNPEPTDADDEKASVVGSESSYWMPSDSDESNSPTGDMILDSTELGYFGRGRRSGSGGWSFTDAETIETWDNEQSGRRILCALALLRVLVDVPALYEQVMVRQLSVIQMLMTNFDLVIVDFIIVAGLTIAPLFYFLFTLSFSLNSSWEHHVYHTHMILVIIPLISTVQMPASEFLTIYRLAAPVISAIAFLISRDQAQMTYWAPLIAKNNRWL